MAYDKNLQKMFDVGRILDEATTLKEARERIFDLGIPAFSPKGIEACFELGRRANVQRYFFDDERKELFAKKELDAIKRLARMKGEQK